MDSNAIVAVGCIGWALAGVGVSLAFCWRRHAAEIQKSADLWERMMLELARRYDPDTYVKFAGLYSRAKMRVPKRITAEDERP